MVLLRIVRRSCVIQDFTINYYIQETISIRLTLRFDNLVSGLYWNYQSITMTTLRLG